MNILKGKIHNQIILAMALGIAAGLIFGPACENLRIIGDIFIRLLKMIIVPLVMASMATGVASIGNIRKLGSIGGKTFIYYMLTTILAVTVGLLLVNIIQPGVGVTLAASDFDPGTVETTSLGSLFKDIVPNNPIAAMAEGNMLSIIFFSLLLGAAIGAAGEKAKPLASFFEALNTIMLRITHWVMKLAPVGVFALMAVTIGTMGTGIFGVLAKYMATVTAGLAIHAVIVLPLILSIAAKYKPTVFIRHMFPAVATAFSTASSAATLPITMECLEKNVGVPNKITSFVLPLGATINMDGTALYEAVAAMFIAQAYGVEVSLTGQIVIALTATVASIGAAAIPGAGLVTMVIVLKAVGLPLEGIGMILAVDRILDMCRTAVNVWGDACGTAVIARLENNNSRQPPPSIVP